MKRINEITSKNPKQWYNHQWNIWNIKHREKKTFSSNIILLIKIKDLNTNPCKNSYSF